MEIWMWIGIVIGAAMLAVLTLLAAKARRRRRERREHDRVLRDRFGIEYDRVVQREGPRNAEQILDARLTAYESMEHSALRPAEREAHTQTWRRAQFGFVDSPERAVREAEHLVVGVMEERGYPTDDAAMRADALSVEDPELATAYRAAHSAFLMADRGNAAVEQLLGAFLVYRELLEHLLARPEREDTTFDAEPPSGAPAFAEDDARVIA